MIKNLRSIAAIFLYSLFGFGALFIRYFIFPFQKNKLDNYETLQKSWVFYIYLLKKLKIIKLEIKDLDKIRNIKNSIIVSTHPSFLDIIILMSIIPHSTCFVAERLANNPFLKGMVKHLFILEGHSVGEMVKETSDKLGENLNVIVFPMGIRHKKHEYPRIRRGTAFIAHKTGKNIVLLNLETSYDFLQIGQPACDLGSKTVTFLLEYLGEISTEDYLNQYTDEVTFKTEITKQIAKTLYKK